jgi:pimeloyl-ACP methyl ester carboxylesterase
VIHVLEDRQDELWALLYADQGGNGRSLAIFIHGFLGDHITTWGQLSKLLEKHAPTDPTLKDWDFLFLGYSTDKISSYLDIARLIATQWMKALRAEPPFKSTYTRFALLGHSLGTLGIRQLLCARVLHPPNMLNDLQSVTLFGTPLNGSRWAKYGKIVGGEIANALKQGNPQLRMLRSWNESVYPQLNWRDVRVILGTDDAVVGSEYADLINFAGDQPAYLLNFDHTDLVKPRSWNKSTIRDEIVAALK